MTELDELAAALTKLIRSTVREVVREEVGCNLMPADYRAAKNLTPDELGTKVGVKGVTIRRWELGAIDDIDGRDTTIKMRTAAFTLGVSVEEYRAAVRRAIQRRRAA